MQPILTVPFLQKMPSAFTERGCIVLSQKRLFFSVFMFTFGAPFPGCVKS